MGEQGFCETAVLLMETYLSWTRYSRMQKFQLELRTRSSFINNYNTDLQIGE